MANIIACTGTLYYVWDDSILVRRSDYYFEKEKAERELVRINRIQWENDWVI
jgi:hypothetical protein